MTPRRPPAPAVRCVDITLRDGSHVHIRPVRSQDRQAIRTFLGALSSESVGFRFFGAANLEWASDWSVKQDDARYGLVATVDSDPAIVAHGVYVRENADCAEVAFVVADALHGHGVATILLGQLAAGAEAHGISILTAVVLPYNHRMLEVFRDSGFTVEQHVASGEIHVRLHDLSLRRDALAEVHPEIAAVQVHLPGTPTVKAKA
jgi:RimJ/RimL family protein N-acetyltransferase